MRLSVSHIAEYTHADAVRFPSGGEAAVAPIVDVTWDSRDVPADSLYLALPGDRVDGHRFAAAAIEAGARCVLTSHDLDAEALAAADARGAAIVQVPDTAAAFTELAGAWRRRLNGTVLALTGSSGKTTTKNLVRDVLSKRLATVATQANQNNELGVPRTLLAAQEDTRAVVVEMGMRGSGQLEELCSFVQPDMALVTNVGESHIELLGSRENIARAKAEVLCALPQGGTAFVNASDPFAMFLVDHARLRERGVRIVFFDGSGTLPSARSAQLRPDVYARDIRLDSLGRPSFELCLPDGGIPCRLGLRGAHNVHNAAAAAAVGWRMGLAPHAIVAALEAARPMSGRQEVIETAGGITIIDDSYNANPDSMRASLALFSQMEVAGRRFAVLGDMGELGDFAQDGHCEVGTLAASAGLHRLICVGSLARIIAQAASDAGMAQGSIACFADRADALDLLQQEIEPGDAVLVKASHSMGLEHIVEELTD